MDRDDIHQENQEGEDVGLGLLVLVKDYTLALHGDNEGGDARVPDACGISEDSVCYPVLIERVGLPCILSKSLTID